MTRFIAAAGRLGAMTQDRDAAGVAVPTAVASAPAQSALGSARQRWWPAWVGDLIAVLAVLLGGGLLLGLGIGLGIRFGGGLGGSGGPRRPPSGDLPGPMVLLHTVEAVLTITAAGLMLLRRRWPLIVFLLVLFCFSLAALLGIPSLGPGIAATIAAYALAEQLPRPWAFAITGAAGGLILLLSLFDIRLIEIGRVSFDARIGAALVIAAALGDSARSRREYLHAVEDRAERAERTREAEAERRVSEERLRIARELHDTVAHQLTVINLHAGAASGYLDARPERAHEALGTIRQAARGALTEIGELLHYLRDAERPGAAPLQQGLDGLGALLARMHDAGLDVRTEIEGDPTRLTDSVGNAAYRVVQEALTNAHKHGSG
ncbi:MAG: hypothetical protein J0H64_06700, partial [Actinobacteria bacterium]|nr:hypothetical protein [Actinomycetota bacterium]